MYRYCQPCFVLLVVIRSNERLLLRAYCRNHPKRSPNDVRCPPPELPPYLTAVGKALLSTYDDEEIFDIIDSDNSTDDSESHVAATMDEFQQIRNRGFAFNDQARIDGERGIAVPVTDEQNERAICSVGIVGSVDTITEPDIDSKSRRFMQNNTQLIQQTAQTIVNKLYM